MQLGRYTELAQGALQSTTNSKMGEIVTSVTWSSCRGGSLLKSEAVADVSHYSPNRRIGNRGCSKGCGQKGKKIGNGLKVRLEKIMGKKVVSYERRGLGVSADIIGGLQVFFSTRKGRQGEEERSLVVRVEANQQVFHVAHDSKRACKVTMGVSEWS